MLFRSNDRLATKEEIAYYMSMAFAESMSEEQATDTLFKNNNQFNSSFCIETDTLWINGIVVYKDGQSIEML